VKTLHKTNERGVGHVLMVILVVVVIAIIAGVGYEVMHKKNSIPTTSATTAQTKAQATAAQSSCLSTYHDSDLCKFVAAEAASPFEKTSSILTLNGTSSGQTTSGTISQDGKGNNSLSLTSNGTTINTVALDGHNYAQASAGGPWIDYGTTASSTTTTPDTSLTSFLGTLSTTTYKKLANEACGNLTCFKYQIVDKTNPSATQYVWFDNQQYLLRKYFESGLSGSDSLTMTIAYQSVNIAKPSPVQSLTSAATPSSSSTGQ
jgi:hypothetical protein